MEDRYCLNDLHKAAGGISRHQPAKDFVTLTTRDLVSEIGEHYIAVKLRRGKAQGAYVCKELVYTYAMWIGLSFNLKVI